MEPTIILNEEQRHAIDLILSKEYHFVFLTGGAGTGKTTVIKELRRQLDSDQKKYLIVAPTGIAAINVGGKTIHSQFHISSRGKPSFSRATFEKDEGLRSFIHSLEFLIIDEISMVRADLMDVLLYILRLYGPYPFEPNGGISVVFAGDLLQLSPILVNPDETPKIKQKYETDGTYQWRKREYDDFIRKYPTSKYFIAAKDLPSEKICRIMLRENHRLDKSDPNQREFYRHLNTIRKGRTQPLGIPLPQDFCLISQPADMALGEACAYFNKRVKKDCHRECDLTIAAVKKIAENINKKRMKELPGKSRIIKAGIKDYIGRDNNEAKAYCENYYLSPILLELKIQAKVMVTKNLYINSLYIPNGSIGTVLSITEKPGQTDIAPQDRDYDVEIEMLRPHKGSCVTLSREIWHETILVSIDKGRTEEVPSLDFSQIPIMPAWAITIHKSQGLTLENYAIFPYGNPAESLIYVALSRAKRLSDIHLEEKLKPEKINCDPMATRFY